LLDKRRDVTEFVTVRARAATQPIFGKVVNENKGRQEGMKGRWESKWLQHRETCR
jgi:hypothetical protein